MSRPPILTAALHAAARGWPSLDESVAGARIDCPSCAVDFVPVTGVGEAVQLAGVHNGLHHGGRAEATTATLSGPAGEAGPVGFASGLGWLLSPSVFEDALSQARPYAGDEQAADRAWSARVDAAVQGMDVVDPAGVDEWIASHAESQAPHLAEAALVAVWETHVRGLFPDSSDTGLLTALDLGDVAERDWTAPELVDDDSDDDGL